MFSISMISLVVLMWTILKRYPIMAATIRMMEPRANAPETELVKTNAI